MFDHAQDHQAEVPRSLLPGRSSWVGTCSVPGADLGIWSGTDAGARTRRITCRSSCLPTSHACLWRWKASPFVTDGPEEALRLLVRLPAMRTSPSPAAPPRSTSSGSRRDRRVAAARRTRGPRHRLRAVVRRRRADDMDVCLARCTPDVTHLSTAGADHPRRAPPPEATLGTGTTRPWMPDVDEPAIEDATRDYSVMFGCPPCAFGARGGRESSSTARPAMMLAVNAGGNAGRRDDALRRFVGAAVLGWRRCLWDAAAAAGFEVVQRQSSGTPGQCWSSEWARSGCSPR